MTKKIKKPRKVNKSKNLETIKEIITKFELAYKLGKPLKKSEIKQIKQTFNQILSY